MQSSHHSLVCHIAACEVAILPNAGHIMSIDEPEVVGTHIVRFLADEAS